jgi:hypothetical protein
VFLGVGPPAPERAAAVMTLGECFVLNGCLPARDPKVVNSTRGQDRRGEKSSADHRSDGYLSALRDSIRQALELSVSKIDKNPELVRKTRDYLAVDNLVGKALDAYDLLLAIENDDDAVKANVGLLALLGGRWAVVAMDLTGFEEKLRTLQAHGRSIPQVMRYCADVAGRLFNPFSLGQPGPYSQMLTLSGPSEPALKSEIRQWLDRIEDSRRWKRR